jgi:hypothetical protein
MSTVTPRISAPPFGSWLYAFISLSLTVLLAMIALIAGILWEHETALGKIEHATEVNDQAALSRLVPIFERGVYWGDLIHDGLTLSATSRQRAQLRHFLYKIAYSRDLLLPEEVRVSLQECSEIDEDKYSAQSQALLQNVEGLLTELAQTHATIAEKREDLKNLELRKRKLLAQHKLVAADVSQFFSLPSSYATDDNSLRAYTKGFLQDLPALERLPDDISDALALREALRVAGGRVVLQSADPAREFIERLAELRQTSSTIVTDYRMSVAQELKISVELRQAENSLHALAKKLRTRVTLSLASALRLSLE